MQISYSGIDLLRVEENQKHNALLVPRITYSVTNDSPAYARVIKTIVNRVGILSILCVEWKKKKKSISPPVNEHQSSIIIFFNAGFDRLTSTVWTFWICY